MLITAKETKLSPLLKYPGGKDKELKFILPLLPPNSENYYEPFIGGGAVYFALNANNYYINDRSTELMNLYEMVTTQNADFFDRIETIDRDWQLMRALIDNHDNYLLDTYRRYKNDGITDVNLDDLLFTFVQDHHEEFNGLLLPHFNIDIQNFVREVIKSLKNKFRRMKKNEAKYGDLSTNDLLLNIECGFKTAFYMHFRHLYNNIVEFNIGIPFATAIYFFIREYCYSSMFRYNKSGKFNVPYGGISYNSKTLTKKIEYFKTKELSNHLTNTTRINDDFENFINNYAPTENDFIFLDPPYDTEFSTYAQNEFGRNDQARLANYLINECTGRFMLVIKNTDYIASLYPIGTPTHNGGLIDIVAFDKNYQVSFQNRNDKGVNHLIIKNY